MKLTATEKDGSLNFFRTAQFNTREWKDRIWNSMREAVENPDRELFGEVQSISRISGGDWRVWFGTFLEKKTVTTAHPDGMKTEEKIGEEYYLYSTPIPIQD